MRYLPSRLTRLSMGLVLHFPALKEAFDPQESAHRCNPQEVNVRGLSHRTRLGPRQVHLLVWGLDYLAMEEVPIQLSSFCVAALTTTAYFCERYCMYELMLGRLTWMSCSEVKQVLVNDTTVPSHWIWLNVDECRM